MLAYQELLLVTLDSKTSRLSTTFSHYFNPFIPKFPSCKKSEANTLCYFYPTNVKSEKKIIYWLLWQRHNVASPQHWENKYKSQQELHAK